MTFVRRNVWELGKDWSDTVLWYARGVAEMKKRPLNDPTSWRFFAGIHGLDTQLWTFYKYLSPTDKKPSPDVQAALWNACQHGTWYFLPWHRGYVLQLEAVVRAAVVKLGGPKDWALPYWNYSKAKEDALPPAFGSPDWPDGKGNNPLYVAQRWGPGSPPGKIYVLPEDTSLKALGVPDFTGTIGGDPGFGGVETAYHHAGRDTPHGDLESLPHDMVHVDVGGQKAFPGQGNLPGLMSSPPTAALDPIFYIHHCNIDRLWEVWNKTLGNKNPSKAAWLSGPPLQFPKGSKTLGYPMPKPDGSTWVFQPKDVVDIAKLGYSYDDLTAPGVQPRQQRRMVRLGMAAAPLAAAPAQETAVAKKAELLGASGEPLRVAAGEADSRVQLDHAVRTKVTQSFGMAMAAAAPREPDRVFLNLENIRGNNDATALRVYLNLPDGANPDDHPELLAGTIALFGVSLASKPDEAHAGSGITQVLDITRIVDELHLADKLDLDHIKVKIVPRTPVAEEDNITIGRISVYRQAQ
jgi:tyrosinase